MSDGANDDVTSRLVESKPLAVDSVHVASSRYPRCPSALFGGLCAVHLGMYGHGAARRLLPARISAVRYQQRFTVDWSDCGSLLRIASLPITVGCGTWRSGKAHAQRQPSGWRLAARAISVELGARATHSFPPLSSFSFGKQPAAALSAHWASAPLALPRSADFVGFQLLIRLAMRIRVSAAARPKAFDRGCCHDRTQDVLRAARAFPVCCRRAGARP